MVLSSVYAIFYSLTFFFRKTRKNKNKIFFLYFLCFSPKIFLKPLCCSYLRHELAIIHAYTIVIFILACIGAIYMFLLLKKRKKEKNKKIYRFYLQFLIFKNELKQKNFIYSIFFFFYYKFKKNSYIFTLFFKLKLKFIKIVDKINFFFKK
jgi:hypothetical protein